MGSFTNSGTVGVSYNEGSKDLEGSKSLHCKDLGEVVQPLSTWSFRFTRMSPWSVTVLLLGSYHPE